MRTATDLSTAHRVIGEVSATFCANASSISVGSVSNAACSNDSLGDERDHEIRSIAERVPVGFVSQGLHMVSYRFGMGMQQLVLAGQFLR